MTATAGKQTRARRRRGLAALLGCALVLTPACRTAGPARAVRPRDLEAAKSVALRQRRRAIASGDVRGLATYRPLGSRLGLLTIRTPGQWARLRRVAEDIGPCPPLAGGAVVVVACHAGLPVDGRWPIRLRAVRTCGGLGLAEVRFVGGSYLSDDTTYLEAAVAPGLRAVVMADVNGTRFYPEPNPPSLASRGR